MPRRKQREVFKVLGQLEWDRCARDPLYWLDPSRHPVVGPYVYTLDNHPLYQCRLCPPEADPHYFNKCGIHLQLSHGREATGQEELRGYFVELSTTRAFTVKEYMPPMVDYWQREQFYMVEKSRDVMATWLVVAMYTWDTLFHTGRQNIFQSEDASKTDELVRRAYFMYQNQPKFIRDLHKASYANGANRSGVFRVPDINSEILGFPQGADQIRQYHPTGVFMDEAAFQEQAGDAFSAIKPAIQAGGRFTAISSANPGWFMLACQDRDQELAQ